MKRKPLKFINFNKGFLQFPGSMGSIGFLYNRQCIKIHQLKLYQINICLICNVKNRSKRRNRSAYNRRLLCDARTTKKNQQNPYFQFWTSTQNLILFEHKPQKNASQEQGVLVYVFDYRKARRTRVQQSRAEQSSQSRTQTRISKKKQ